LKAIENFCSRFGGKVSLQSEFLVEKVGRFYFLNPQLKNVIRSDFFYAGLYVGKLKKGIFFPSFNLLKMLANVANNKIVVNPKAAWLFICGRDLLKDGLVKVYGSQRRGKYTLILNKYGECLGFGRIVGSFDGQGNAVLVKNILDLGDFLRRES